MSTRSSFYGPDEKFVPTPDYIIEAKVRLANLNPDDVVYDLGCGDGRVLIHACQQHGVKGFGVDLDDDKIQKAKEDITNLGLDELIHVSHKNYLNIDLSGATVLLLYLTRNSLGHLSRKLEEELAPGTKIITHSFDIPAWSHDSMVEVNSPNGTTEILYLYTQKK